MRGGPGGAETDGGRQWRHLLVAPCRRPNVPTQPSTTLGGVVIPSPHPPFGYSRSRVSPVFGAPCPRYSGSSLSRVRPPSSKREVGTLSDSALEPCSRRPAPQPPAYTVVGSVRGLGFGVCPERFPQTMLRIRTRPSTFPLLADRRKLPEPLAYTVVASGTTPLSTEPSAYAVVTLMPVC